MNAAKKIVWTRLAIVTCTVVSMSLCRSARAATVCVNPGGTGGCYAKIQLAVNASSAGDTVKVEAGTYQEDVLITKSVHVIGAGADDSIVDATGLDNGFLVNGLPPNSGLKDVTIAGFAVQNAQFEGIAIVSASGVTISDNHIINNDKSPGLFFTGNPTGCPGQPLYETDETGDCGGAIHLIGTSNSIVSGNVVSGNADGILISDETAESSGNLIIHNILKNNPLECGIVLASHPPMGSIGSPHFGVDHNTVADNVSTANGVQIGGAGVGLFSDGIGPGRTSENVITHNTLIGNGLGGVALHTHVGPAFHAPADNMNGNVITGNFIAGNLADTFDTATPGRVGININSGGGGSPVLGTVISHNVIRDEDVDIAVNTPAEVDIHLNNLLGGKIGVADVCVLDNGAGYSTCIGTIDATQNFWGCEDGPGAKRCTTTGGSNIQFVPWLDDPVKGVFDPDDRCKDRDECDHEHNGAWLRPEEGTSDGLIRRMRAVVG